MWTASVVQCQLDARSRYRGAFWQARQANGRGHPFGVSEGWPRILPADKKPRTR